ncbi:MULTISPECIES: oxidoreductase [Cysteiniphilum]|uniref:SDR family oxidoreductase n=1 Tax=Cysteiniphilum litorale TaxID=2056700 RepID=A0A8J3E8M7_9GAMM|nr:MULTISPECIES: oxidoreductase [Cysteiniphilum]GGF94508.1 SDR family oxidoreductase [Cysteiniphilum litorale]
MLDGKVVVVTGGAGLIGKAFIRSIVENKGIAVIADSNIVHAMNVSKELSLDLHSDRVLPMQIDITNKNSISSVIEKLHDDYGKIDALVNNAYPRNKNYGKHFFDVTYDDFAENTSMNLGGYFLTSQQFAQYFKNQGWGNIINIASIYGVVAPKFEIYGGTNMTTPVEYAAIKSGVIHLTRYMAAYFKGLNIRVNAISPGGILDNQPESFLQKYKENCLNKGMLDPKDLCGALVYLLSDLSKHVNGQNIIVDDGFSQ